MATDHNFRIKNGLTVGSVEVIDSSGKLTANAFGTNADEKIEDVAAAMITGATHSNITVTYNDTNGTLAFSAAAQYGDSDVEDYLDGGTSTPVFSTITSNGQITSSGKLVFSDKGDYIQFGSGGTDISWTAPVIFRESAHLALSDYSGVKLGGYNGTNYGPRVHVKGDGNLSILDGALQIGNTTVIGSDRDFITDDKLTFDYNDHYFQAGTNSVAFKNSGGTSYVVISNTGLSVTGAITGSSNINITGNLTQTQSSGNNQIYLNSSGGGAPVIYMEDPNRKWGQFVSNGHLHFKDETGNINALIINSGGESTFAAALNAPTLNTGQGDNELYAMNQNVRTTDSPTFAGGEYTGTLTIDSGTAMGLRIEHDTFGNALEIHREHDTNAASIRFSNNSGRTGTLLAIHAETDLYWQKGTGTTNYRIWTEENDGPSSGLNADLLDDQHGSYYLNYNNFTNTPTIPSLSGYATESYVNTQVSNLVDSAPGTLNTLNELAAALGDDANFSTTVTNSIATKLPLAGGTMTGTLNMNSNSINNARLSGSQTYLPGHAYSLTHDGTNVYWHIGSASGSTNKVLNLRIYNSSNSYVVNQWSTTGLSVAGTVSATGGNSTNWNTAYGWGNHASAGYLTSFDITTQTDPKYLRSNAADTATGDINFARASFGSASLHSTGGAHGVVTDSLSLHSSGSDLMYMRPSAGRSDNGYFQVQTYNGGNGGDIELQPYGGSVTISTGSATAGSQNGLRFQTGYGNYTDGRYQHRFRKRDEGGGIPLYIDQSTSTANSFTAIARFGEYSGNSFKFEVFGNAKVDGLQVSSEGSTSTLTLGKYDSTDQGVLALTGSTANKQSVIKTTNGNLHIDSNAGNNTYINFYTGSGTYFGTGAGGIAAVMGPDGDLWKGTADNSGSKYWHAGNDGSGSGLHADLLDGFEREHFTNAEDAKLWTGINASATQAKRYHIARLYGCPAHWDSNWQNIEFIVTAESYESAFLKFRLMGDYGGAGSQANMIKVYLQDAQGPLVNNFRFVLGSPVDAGWDHSGQDTYYVDLYAEVRSYGQYEIHAKTYGHPTQSSNPTSGGATTVFYGSPTVSNISDFSVNHIDPTFRGYKIWHAGNDGANSTLDADLLDGQEGSYYLDYNNFTNTPTISANNYYLDGISKSGNTLTFSVNGTTNQTYTFGSNAFNSTTIPTNNNQLTNGAGYITSFDITTQTDPKYLRSDTSDSMSGELNVSRNGGVTGSSAPNYSQVNIELQTSSNHVPGISFHRGGYSATTLYEYDGELYTNAWTTRAQTGKLLSSGNIASYASAYKYVFAKNNGTHNGGTATATVAQDGLFIDGTNGITTSASGDVLVLSGANLLRSDTADTATQINSPIFSGNISTSGDGQNNYPFRLTSDYNSYMTAVAGNTWGLFWAGNSGARYGTNGNGGPGNIWGNSSNPNEFVFVGSDSTKWTVYGNNGNTWQAGNFRMNGALWEGFHGGTGTGCTHLDRVGGIRLGWDNGTYGTQNNHSIRSTYGDTYGDDITINSYHHLRFNIDTNANNTDEVFQVGRHTTGTGNILMTLDTSGNFSTSGNVTAYSSDRRLKKNFKKIENPLDKLLSLNGYNFDWRMDKLEGTTFEPDYETNDIGLIAQEVQAVCEQATAPAPFDIQYNEETKKHESQSGENYLTVNYDKLVPLLVEAVKEQQEQIEELKSIINTLVESK